MLILSNILSQSQRQPLPLLPGNVFCQVCLTKISLTHFSVQVWGNEIFPLSERQGSGARM